MKKLYRTALFTDIHHGRMNNSVVHNTDCNNFIEWFCDNVKKYDCDNVVFMGDWHENRSALNISTLNYSYRSAKMLNELNIPIYFIIGNHDLYQRHTRELHSVVPFVEFKNFNMIESPTIVENVGDSMLLVPYLFHDEYPNLVKYKQIPMWAGHFEFKGFEVTGYGIKMQTGPEPEMFKGPKAILSGHFHKRQNEGNIHYIGNTFGMDMGDAGDFARGMAIYDHKKHTINYLDWADGPKYQKLKLTDVLDERLTVHMNSRVKCTVDVDMSYEESLKIKQMLIDKYKLRELKFHDNDDSEEILNGDASELNETDKLLSIDELVLQMLSEIDSKSYDNKTLINIYNTLN